MKTQQAAAKERHCQHDATLPWWALSMLTSIALLRCYFHEMFHREPSFIYLYLFTKEAKIFTHLPSRQITLSLSFTAVCFHLSLPYLFCRLSLTSSPSCFLFNTYLHCHCSSITVIAHLLPQSLKTPSNNGHLSKHLLEYLSFVCCWNAYQYKLISNQSTTFTSTTIHPPPSTKHFIVIVIIIINTQLNAYITRIVISSRHLSSSSYHFIIISVLFPHHHHCLHHI